MTIKLTITKRTISRKKKKSGWNNKKKSNKREHKIGERESIDFFVMDNLEGIGERGRNEIRRNLYEN